MSGMRDLKMNALFEGVSRDICTEQDFLLSIVKKPRGVKKGDLWALGNHRLLVDDAFSEANWQKLIGKEKVRVLFTDPPYGINVVHKKKNELGHVAGMGYRKGAIGPPGFYPPIIGDDKPFDPRPIMELAKKFGVKKMLFFGGNHFSDKLPVSSCWFVWDKRAGKVWNVNLNHLELIWTNLKKASKIYYYLWHGMIKSTKEEDIRTRYHPTQKPVGLLRAILQDCSGPEEAVIDPFAGAGSMLIACIKTGQRCFLMEISPTWSEIILERYYRFTGKEPVLIG